MTDTPPNGARRTFLRRETNPGDGQVVFAIVAREDGGLLYGYAWGHVGDGQFRETRFLDRGEGPPTVLAGTADDDPVAREIGRMRAAALDGRRLARRHVGEPEVLVRGEVDPDRLRGTVRALGYWKRLP